MENILSVDQIDNQQLRPFGYIYITTNLINNKKYIGMHKSSTFNPNYKGSGKILWRAISKYGWNNFKVEILKWCFSKEELIDQEKYFIESYHACESRGFYNCMEGGHGGNNKTYLSEEEYEKFIDKIRQKASRPHHTEKQFEADKKRNIGRKLSEETKQKIRESNRGQKRSKEARQHMRENHADVSGKNNPMYGVHLVVSEETCKKLSKNTKGKVWITDCNDDEKLVYPDEVKLFEGYVRGRLRKYQKQKVKFND